MVKAGLRSLIATRTAARRPLQSAWRADADQLPHEQAEIVAARLNQQSLANVGMAAEVYARRPPVS